MKTMLKLFFAMLLCSVAFLGMKPPEGNYVNGDISLIKQPFLNYDVATVVATNNNPTKLQGIVSFGGNIPNFTSTGLWAVIQIDYKLMVGDSCKVRFYASATNDFTGITTALNASSLLKGAATSTAWKTGQGYGTNVTKYELINLTNYPVGYIKSVIDTTTGITAGNVTVTIKSLFHCNPEITDQSFIKSPVYNYAITTKSIKRCTIPFYPNYPIRGVIMQVNYRSMAGNAYNWKLFASGSDNFIDTTRINSTTAVKWTTGANITKWDTIYLGSIPTRYLLLVGDTCSGSNTAGYSDVSFKPIFK
jgi:hypothetical protein